MTEERARFEVLMENVDTSLKVLAEAHVAQVERLDRIDGRLERVETKVDKLDIRVGVLEAKVDKLEVKVDKLEVFAGDTQQRLGRIETHLHMNGAHPRRSPQQPTKRSKKR